MDLSTLLDDAYRAFDRENGKDPNSVTLNGVPRPKELVFAERLTGEVLALDPDASVPLRLAARCQHICRWEVPRDTQPPGRAGYLKWREGLKKHHAQKAGGILREVGCPGDIAGQVQSLNLKKNLGTDPDCQTLEDALCLVFLRHQFDDLIATTDDGKMVRIVQKTWAKMSGRGQMVALALDYSKAARDVLDRALA